MTRVSKRPSCGASLPQPRHLHLCPFLTNISSTPALSERQVQTAQTTTPANASHEFGIHRSSCGFLKHLDSTGLERPKKRISGPRARMLVIKRSPEPPRRLCSKESSSNLTCRPSWAHQGRGFRLLRVPQRIPGTVDGGRSVIRGIASDKIRDREGTQRRCLGTWRPHHTEKSIYSRTPCCRRSNMWCAHRNSKSTKQHLL